MSLMTAGGGLSTLKLKDTTAQPDDVLLNKTFYAGDKNKKTGTFNLGAANATPDKVLNGSSFYSNNNKTLQWGSIWPYGAQTWANSVGISGDTLYIRIPQGAYLQNASTGYPEIMVSRSASFKAGTVSTSFAGNNWAQRNYLTCAGTVLGITAVRGTNNTYVGGSISTDAPSGRGMRFSISGNQIVCEADNLVKTGTIYIDYIYI